MLRLVPLQAKKVLTLCKRPLAAKALCSSSYDRPTIGPAQTSDCVTLSVEYLT